MDKLKYIKIENEDGTLSDNVPIGADAANIDMDDGSNVETKMSDLNTAILNTIAENSRIANKVTNLESEVSSLASGSPAGVYDTVAALTAADPNHNKIYLVTADGHWYYYNNGWQDGGIYQASSDADEIAELYDIVGANNYKTNLMFGATLQLRDFVYNGNNVCYLKILDVDTQTFAGVRVYEMQHETTTNPYVTLVDIVDTWDNVKDSIIRFTIKNPDLCKRIRVGIRNSSAPSHTAQFIFYNNDNEGNFLTSIVETVKKNTLRASSKYMGDNVETINDSNVAQQIGNKISNIMDMKMRYLNQVTASLLEDAPEGLTQLNGMLMQFMYKENYNKGRTQIIFDSKTTYGNIYWRNIVGANDDTPPIVHNWHKIQVPHSLEYGQLILRDTSWEGSGFTSLADITDEKVYYLYRVTSEMAEDVPKSPISGMLWTIKYSPNSIPGTIQIIHTTSDGMFYRIAAGSASAWSWGRWVHLEEKGEEPEPVSPYRLNHLTCKIFKKVVCCGDSYTSGYIKTADGTKVSTNEEFAWPHYMATLTGNNWVNCGHSGSNAKTWLINERGLPKAQASGRAQAYIIGLGINDSSSDPARHLEVGDISDIGTDNESYYAYYSKVIRELKAISPKAKIFCATGPTGVDTAHNQAIRNIAEAYASTYDTFLLDLAISGMYGESSLTGDAINGHYTAIGYEQFSEILAEYLSNYINNHISSFQDVAWIPYDE